MSEIARPWATNEIAHWKQRAERAEAELKQAAFEAQDTELQLERAEAERDAFKDNADRYERMNREAVYAKRRAEAALREIAEAPDYWTFDRLRRIARAALDRE